jgi:hypothetical protein
MTNLRQTAEDVGQQLESVKNQSENDVMTVDKPVRSTD